MLFLSVLSASAHATSYSSALAQAIEMCTVLAPGHEAQLGNVDSSEASYWFHKARFEASRTFWSAKGLRFLEAQLSTSNDELRSVCIHQLIEEARAGDEVPPNYSFKRTADVGLR